MTNLVLPNGKPIKFQPEQTLIYSVIAGFLGAGFIAGLYFGILEVNWHIFWLKPWWDHLYSQGWWPVYRHTAFRDIPEPAFATLGVYTLLAKQKYWDIRVGWLRLVSTPVALIVITFAAGIAGTYLLYVAPWAHNHDFASVVTWHAVGNIVLGFIIGRVLHPLWQPVGATIQGRILERNADKWANRLEVPLWVKLPVAPPVVRLRFTLLYNKSKLVTGSIYDSSTGRAVLIGVMVLVFIVVTAVGVIGHYWVGTGHVFSLLPTTR